MFQVNADGSGFTNLYNFSGSGEANVDGTLVINSNILYGATINGGTNNAGTLFALALPVPILNIQLIGNTAILSWSDSGFLLQAAPAVTGVFTNVFGAASPYTNPVNNAEEFSASREISGKVCFTAQPGFLKKPI